MSFQRESVEAAVARWQDLEALQRHYTDFWDFLYDVQLEVFNWDTTPVQFDIGEFLQHGGRYIMIQAQRGQAKTTITAIYAVWCLIHDPKHRVIIISAAGDKANEIAKGIINIINAMPILECMRPDRNAGDRTSTEAFDLHYTLRGDNMNPSIKCMGITSNLQGKRADLLIADDIESSKNGTTQTQRNQLLHLTRDFSSICTDGRIVYLGTPQTIDSIYNTLPGRGFTVRIWPGRFPTVTEELEYGGALAPFITTQMQHNPELRTGGGILGDEGQPIDVRLSEAVLQEKELDQGPAYFKLQHMLCTKLADSERFPLKSRNLIFMHLNPEEVSGKITWQPKPELMIPPFAGSNLQEEFYRPMHTLSEMFPYGGRMMYVDTAGGGQNGDETAAAVTFFLHGYVFLMDVKGFPGGHRDDVFEGLSALAYKWGVNIVQVEKNFGNGAFAQTWRPIMDKYFIDTSGGSKSAGPFVEDVWESGQKELRIIENLEPIMARHSLIVNEHLLQQDVESVQKYAIDKRCTYMLFHQLARITRDRGALMHDDRLDAVAGAVRYWVNRINQDADKVMQQRQQEDIMKFFIDPFGHNKQATGITGLNAFTKFDRR